MEKNGYRFEQPSGTQPVTVLYQRSPYHPVTQVKIRLKHVNVMGGMIKVWASNWTGLDYNQIHIV